MQSSLSAKMPKVITYDRDIICLPKSLAESDSKIAIPQSQKARSMLASNGLIGQIHLKSSMSEKEIRREIRSVFRKPMNFKKHFLLLTFYSQQVATAKPLLFHLFRRPISGQPVLLREKNTKTPIYILAQEDLMVCST